VGAALAGKWVGCAGGRGRRGTILGIATGSIVRYRYNTSTLVGRCNPFNNSLNPLPLLHRSQVFRGNRPVSPGYGWFSLTGGKRGWR